MGHVVNVYEYPQPSACRVVECVRPEKLYVLIESLGNLNIGWLVFGIFKTGTNIQEAESY